MKLRSIALPPTIYSSHKSKTIWQPPLAMRSKASFTAITAASAMSSESPSSAANTDDDGAATVELKTSISENSKKELERHHQNIKALYERSEKLIDRYSVLPHQKSDDYFVLINKMSKCGLSSNSARAGVPADISDSVPKPSPLVLKRLEDSYCEIFLPFRDDRALREEYVNYRGKVRLGKILEDLDRLAGAISYRHMSDANGNIAPLTIVTAAVDRIDLSSPLRLDRNYRISGMVTYTGYSSLEVFMTLNAIDDKGNIIDSERVLSARFTMVARDKYTDKAAQVNPLLLQNDEERRLFKIAEMIKEHKKTNSQRTLSKLPPTAEERIIMHDLWLETNSYITSLYKSSTVPLPRDMAWLDETTMESVTLCFPQERNIHNKIFGGYLMRLAHELAFANASVFIQDHALYVSLDDFSFRAPVNIGSILRLTSEVVYTQRESNTFQVAVRADVIDNTKGTVHNTNTFYFTFQAPNGPIKKVIPRTYSDMMKYLEGRRRHTMGSYIAKLEQAL